MEKKSALWKGVSAGWNWQEANNNNNDKTQQKLNSKNPWHCLKISHNVQRYDFNGWINPNTFLENLFFLPNYLNGGKRESKW